jgi:hypothetical protein
MKGNAARYVRFGAGLLGLVTLGWVLTGQAAKPVPQGLPMDWTHRHVIFSQPATAEQVRMVEHDPRYWQQWLRHNTARSLPIVTANPGPSTPFGPVSYRPTQRDWSKNLGNGASVGANVFPAKYAFVTATVRCGNATHPDFVIFSTGLLGSGSQASLIAYDNLWTGCGGTVPQGYWAYNTGGQILTSPVFSQDGTEVAFVQTNGSAASLVVLKWKFSNTQTVSSPGVPTVVAAASFAACVAPCMTSIALTDGSNVATNDVTSSVFYDYSGGTAWVGDNHGWLHKFTAIFTGTPAEVRTAPWPVQVNSGSPTTLASPVHDTNSHNIFLGDAGGFFYRVHDTTGVVTKSARVDFGNGIVAGSLLDLVSGRVYVFSSSDGSGSCAGGPCAAVFQFPINFAAAATGTRAPVGASSNVSPNPLYSGIFDSAYETSVNGTGSLYVCGNTGAAPTLYQIPIVANTMGTVNAGPALANTTTPCSPVSDVRNPNAAGGIGEWIFASAHAGGLGTTCGGGGCIMNFKDRPWTANTAYTVGQQIVDNLFQVQTVRTAGTSSGSTPAWSTVVGGSTSDGTTNWINQGTHAAVRASWVASHAYIIGDQILDPNKNVQVVTKAGTSQASSHVWNTNPNGNTTDGTVIWRETGPLATFSLNAAGGTSGIIMDSTVAGASDVYYSTQSNQTCGSTGTGGCAVQATQSALQ